MKSALPLLLLPVVACDESRPEVIIEPPIPLIEMDGEWAVSGLARLGSMQPLPTAPGGPADAFRPLYEGMTLVIEGGQLRDGNGEPLLLQWSAPVPSERYFNAADGIALHFDWASSGGAPCAWREEVTVHGMAIDEDRIGISAAIVSTAACTNPAGLPAEATGQFQFVLARVAHPAAAAQTAASDR
jgi:hypothetical protein